MNLSGTDHSVKIEYSQQPRIVLVRPQMGENIGSAARAMWNFELNQMNLVDPRDGWPNPAAIAMASGAAPVLDNVQVSPNVEGAVSDLHYVFATTARQRNLTKEILSPKAAMERARALINQGQRVGVLFGAERSGLENSEIMSANALVSVPVNPAFGSLNLAQCVLLLSYEWRLANAHVTNAEMDWASSAPATRADVDYLIENITEKLDSLGFFWPDKKAESMRSSLRNMLSRLPLSDIDVRTFHGIFRALWKGEKFKNKRNTQE